jgi:hypothetical protein
MDFAFSGLVAANGLTFRAKNPVSGRAIPEGRQRRAARALVARGYTKVAMRI